jgi:hypothetical protein
MTQLNLLPDVKMEYIKAKRSQRLAVSIALLASVIAIGLLILLLAADGLQKKHLSDLSRDITTDSSKLQNQPQITKVLTVQNQLESLTSLHESKPAATEVFGYLNSVTPAQVDINNFSIDFTQFSITVTGTADSLSSINQYVDTLKATTYTSDQNPGTSLPAFSSVVLSSFGLTNPQTGSNGQPSGQPASYTITFSYDKNIFDITQKIKLVVPNLTTPRSNDLFQAPANSKGSK